MGSLSGFRSYPLAQQFDLGREPHERLYSWTRDDLGQGSRAHRYSIANPATERHAECESRERTEDPFWLSEPARRSRTGLGKQINRAEELPQREYSRHHDPAWRTLRVSGDRRRQPHDR